MDEHARGHPPRARCTTATVSTVTRAAASSRSASSSVRVGVALGFELADPIVGLAITLVILKITWESWRTVRDAEPGELDVVHEH